MVCHIDKCVGSLLQMLVTSPQGMQSLGNSSAIQRGLDMIVRQTQNTQEECHTLHTRQEQFVIQYQEVIKLQGNYLFIWNFNDQSP